jgi:hypothetical protein
VTQSDLIKTLPNRRIKATDGMAVTAEVWEEAHTYHRQHQELHALLAHGTGIVAGLQVVANDPPDTKVYIRPGMAIDPSGRAIVLNEPRTYEVGAAEGRLFIVMAYGESPAPSGNGQAQDGAPLYVQSQYSVAATSVLPAGPHVELARLVRTRRGAPIADAKDPAAPAGNELDLRFRRMSAVPVQPVASVGLVHLGGGAQPAHHGRGAQALARGLRSAGRSVWVDDGVSLDAGLAHFSLVYLVGHDTFQLSSNEMNALYGVLQKGGTLVAESCRRDAAAAGRAEASFGGLFSALGVKLENVGAGHRLLLGPALFSSPPAGFETGGAPHLQAGEGVLYSTADYGCLWSGERRSGPAAREDIRAAHEFGLNLVDWALERARPG